MVFEEIWVFLGVFEEIWRVFENLWGGGVGRILCFSGFFGGFFVGFFCVFFGGFDGFVIDFKGL